MPYLHQIVEETCQNATLTDVFVSRYTVITTSLNNGATHFGSVHLRRNLKIDLMGENGVKISVDCRITANLKDVAFGDMGKVNELFKQSEFLVETLPHSAQQTNIILDFENAVNVDRALLDSEMLDEETPYEDDQPVLISNVLRIINSDKNSVIYQAITDDFIESFSPISEDDSMPF